MNNQHPNQKESITHVRRIIRSNDTQTLMADEMELSRHSSAIGTTNPNPHCSISKANWQPAQRN